jgi:hypothetical protein
MRWFVASTYIHHTTAKKCVIEHTGWCLLHDQLAQVVEAKELEAAADWMGALHAYTSASS